MPQDKFLSVSTTASRTRLWTALGVIAALLFFLISGAVSFSNVQILKSDSAKIAHTHDVIVALDTLLSTMLDAETGQRGFLLTGNEQYLQPYDDAVLKVDSAL